MKKINSLHHKFKFTHFSKKSVFLAAFMGLINQTPFAAEFFTIIGPDGRPMIIQKSDSQDEPKSETRNSKSSKHSDVITQQNEQKQAVQTTNTQKIASKTTIEKQMSEQNTEKKIENQLDRKTGLNDSKEISHTPQPLAKTEVSTSDISDSHDLSTQTTVLNNEKSHTDSIEEQSAENVELKPNSVEQITQPNKQNAALKTNNKITVLDGVEYVDNEYLEDREFNLEGRKRFYVVNDPSGVGAARFETVQREKGVTKSVLSKFLKTVAPVHSQTIVLSPTYLRMEKDELTQALGQTCFTGKKINKAKTLKLNDRDLGLWPVAPIKESFSYDVVRLESGIKQIELQSFASSQKNPKYYWPLVVFLDQQGCVLEGATGYKNDDSISNVSQYSSLKGVLKIPEHTQYILMTPLAESIEIKDLKLTNSGQIKLKALD